MGFLEELKHRKKAVIVDLPVILEDGKPAQLKCRPVVPGELMNHLEGVGGIPIVQPGVDRDISKEEGMKIFRWAKTIVIRSVYALRIIEKGEELWINIELTDDIEADTPVDLPAADGKPERTLLRLVDFDFFDPNFINNLADQIIVTNTNFGGDMSDLGRPRFQGDRPDPVPSDGT